MKLTLAKIAAFMSATGEFVSGQEVNGYSIDSRTVGPGQLFFAVKGERLDGHDFVEQALEREAASAVVRRDQLGRYSGKTKTKNKVTRGGRHSGCATDTGHRRAEGVGQTADCGNGIGRKDHHQRSHRPRVELTVSSDEVGGELQQPFRIALDVAEVRA